MEPQASDRDFDSAPEDSDRDELLKTVASMRDDLYSMATEVRDVLRENAALKQQLEQQGGSRGGDHWMSEAQRIKREVDQLVRMHEAAQVEDSLRQRAARPAIPTESSHAGNSAWMKKMMMFMMLSELF